MSVGRLLENMVKYSQVRPYKFKAYMKETLWGGNRIAPFKGITSTSSNIGESWEISGVPGHESVVAANGGADDADVGLSLPGLIDKYGVDLVGERVYRAFGNKFPLLVKFIDARQDLSIQVHPNDELARKRHGCAGKTEMWYVVAAQPGAKVYSGLRRSLTPAEFEQLVALASSGNVFEDVISAHDSHEGSAFFLPAGRIHAIGAGNFLAEIQQTSDITYRIYDFGRKGADGKSRELHTALAKDAIDYRVLPEADYCVRYDASKPRVELVRCDYFRVCRVEVETAAHLDLKTDSFVILVCLKGAAEVNGVSVRQGETLLVPALDNVMEIAGAATFLTATA